MKLKIEQDEILENYENYEFDKIEEIKYKILRENEIQIFRYGFTYNNMTEFVVEIQPKDLENGMEELEKIEEKSYDDGIIIGKPTEDFFLLFKLFTNPCWMGNQDMFHYLSIRKENVKTDLEKMNLFLFLLSKINKNNFEVIDLHINENRYKIEKENDDYIPPLLTNDISLKISNEEQFQYALWSELMIDSDKYRFLYMIIENICCKKKEFR